MRIPFRLLTTSILALALIGCQGSATSALDDHHVVTGDSSFFSCAFLDSSKDRVTVDLGGKTVLVTVGQLTSKCGGCLELPATWNHLELVESGDTIVVNVDGNQITRIRPSV